MLKPFSEYTSQFFWDFKKMDNVNYNFEIVELLYRGKEQNNNDKHFNKPILIIIVAIIECMLYDFVVRIQTHRSDTIPNLASAIILFFRNAKETDELKILIPRLQQQNLLRAGPTDTLYADLEELRRLRNRVHIQNKFYLLDKDEYNVYTDEKLKLAEVVFERVCEVLCNVYPRWSKQPLPMSDFPRPWK